MSVEANKALIERWLNAWVQADLNSVDGLFDPEYTVNESLVGPAGVKQAIKALNTALSSISLTTNDIIAEGDRVVVRWTLRGIHSGPFLGLQPTGKAISLTGINVYRIRDQRIVANHEQVGIWELRQLLEARTAS